MAVVILHGIFTPEYFAQHIAQDTNYLATGIGDNPSEAFEDALCQLDGDFVCEQVLVTTPSVKKRFTESVKLSTLLDQKEFDSLTADTYLAKVESIMKDVNMELYYHVSIAKEE